MALPLTVVATSQGMIFSQTNSVMMGKLGAAVTGTDPRSTGGHPQLSTRKKGDSK
jgi:hypothetical protein